MNLKQSLYDLSIPRAGKITEGTSEGCVQFALAWQETTDFIAECYFWDCRTQMWACLILEMVMYTACPLCKLTLARSTWDLLWGSRWGPQLMRANMTDQIQLGYKWGQTEGQWSWSSSQQQVWSQALFPVIISITSTIIVILRDKKKQVHFQVDTPL